MYYYCVCNQTDNRQHRQAKCIMDLVTKAQNNWRDVGGNTHCNVSQMPTFVVNCDKLKYQ